MCMLAYWLPKQDYNFKKGVKYNKRLKNLKIKKVFICCIIKKFYHDILQTYVSFIIYLFSEPCINTCNSLCSCFHIASVSISKALGDVLNICYDVLWKEYDSHITLII
ncbi:hypothetical protein BpHYR1_047264 [Brachionus plicatilis]|uniref:Uncharacterized protein n=1 Tax=Brachionus plicatilis TaxID=10195 RepID=A0A3M7PJ62_BRAPC|nr:hypothetical protein BpHYR1_047264 [Brachionus plicatilis]